MIPVATSDLGIPDATLNAAAELIGIVGAQGPAAAAEAAAGADPGWAIEIGSCVDVLADRAFDAGGTSAAAGALVTGAILDAVAILGGRAAADLVTVGATDGVAIGPLAQVAPMRSPITTPQRASRGSAPVVWSASIDRLVEQGSRLRHPGRDDIGSQSVPSSLRAGLARPDVATSRPVER